MIIICTDVTFARMLVVEASLQEMTREVLYQVCCNLLANCNNLVKLKTCNKVGGFCGWADSHSEANKTSPSS